MKELIITKEAWILRELGFHLDVEHPHKFLLNYLSMLRTSKVHPGAKALLIVSSSSYRSQARLTERWHSMPGTSSMTQCGRR